MRVLPYGLATAQTVNKIGADKYEGPGLAVQWVEFEGPLYDAVAAGEPSPPLRRLATGQGADSQQPQPLGGRLVRSDEPTRERILRRFAGRAFRRAVTDEDIAPFVALVEQKLAAQYSFEQAVRVA